MHVLFCNWRDTENPEGGGSERYVENMARGLVQLGHEVTIACATYEGAQRTEIVDGVRFVRRGTKLDIYVRTFLALLLGRYGTVDAVVDVQNGLPFFTRLATRKPVVVLVHHVHREQWPVVYPGLIGRVGWWIESRLAPRIYRHSQYVAVSDATRLELIELGVDRDRIAIVHNGNDPAPVVDVVRSPTPRMCVVGRLVPHKQVEHAIDAVADLTQAHPDLVLDVIGAGWWENNLREHADARGVADRVVFHGYVDDRTKHQLLAQSWVMALPSLKEGWGIVVGEAGTHATPTVAYSSAGGTNESIDHKGSGYLADTPAELTAALGEILADERWRAFLGQGALAKSHTFTWPSSQRDFAELVTHAR
ncbi:glycosyltransferase family 4 protein [Aeromicrobium wangtongii]|uniref:glycosyltransferase family 4 protein n=1 Tax=Aeromicrobium wangtongii TaxID=2969247 RepID=UPI0020171794|nr:glycosyltransferase family 4 protein [Aeromicrobium wangtongii]MCL3818528.1 glycosyltransferase family 4 protein [Aeromicrobium wangtongii]